MATDLLLVILGKIARVGFIAPLDRTRVLSRFAHGDFQKGRFPNPVGADDGNAFAAHDGQSDALKNALFAVALGNSGEL